MPISSAADHAQLKELQAIRKLLEELVRLEFERAHPAQRPPFGSQR